MSRAWILELGAGRSVAVGVREQVHLLSTPSVYELPAAPPACRQLLFWNERVLPVLDLGRALDGQPTQGAQQLLGIYAYPRDASTVDVGAIWLATPPRQVQVADSMSTRLPAAWQRLASHVLACFELEGRAIPILDLASFFNGPLRGSPKAAGTSASSREMAVGQVALVH